jgi:hypothetical protein
MSLYEFTVPQLKKMLTGIDRWLVAGEAHADKKKFDPAVLLASRLAPDQFQLLKQIQNSCDNAKFIVSRLTGKEPPNHPDTEETIAELRLRIQTVQQYLDTFRPADFEGAESRKITLSFFGGKYLTGSDYLTEFAFPNFYFHVSMTYAILRHNGVDLGKQDFIGSLNLREG